MFTRSNVLTSLCVILLGIRPLGGQIYSSSRLCESLSKKATRQRFKLCQNNETNLEVVRVRRDVNSTTSTNQTGTPTTSTTPACATRTPNVCSGDYEPKSPNGFSPNGDGLNLTVNCAKSGNQRSTMINWQIPKSQPGKADCVGYVVRSSVNEGFTDLCHYITNKTVTSYVLDSTKGWVTDGGRLWIAVFPLPFMSVTTMEYQIPWYEPPRCPEYSGTTSTTSNTSTTSTTGTTALTTATSPTSKLLPASTSTIAATVNSGPDPPVINKMVFAIVISSIAVAILAIIFVLYWRRGNPVRDDKNGNKSVEGEKYVKVLQAGPPHYISYHTDNKNIALDVARWLQAKNVNVVIDIFSVFHNPRVWSEQQLSKAEKIIMIVSKRFLELCSLRQSTSNKGKTLSDHSVYNEISSIKHILGEKPCSDKCIVVLVDTHPTALPYWLSQLKCYEYKNGKLDEEILNRLKPNRISKRE